MVGELLGDGSITFPGKRGNNARFVITIGIDNYPYLLHLRYNIYKDLCRYNRRGFLRKGL